MVQPTERADARANRARLIEAAHDIFRARGLDAEMKEIAERAGIGVGTIYRNFPTKDDLIAAVIGEAISAMQANLDAALTITDPIAAVHAFLAGGFAVAEQYGDLLAAMMHGKMPDACREQFARLDGLQRAAELIRHGIRAGVFRADLDAEIAAAQLVASFVPWHYQQLRRERTLEQIVSAYADLFLRGVRRA